MKKIITALLFTAGCSIGAFAQSSLGTAKTLTPEKNRNQSVTYPQETNSSVQTPSSKRSIGVVTDKKVNPSQEQKKTNEGQKKTISAGVILTPQKKNTVNNPNKK